MKIIHLIANDAALLLVYCKAQFALFLSNSPQRWFFLILKNCTPTPLLLLGVAEERLTQIIASQT